MPHPDHLSYTEDHEWLDLDGELATVGITAFAADALGDVVYVDLPEVGVTVKAGTSCGELESTKSVSDLYAPCNGEVIEVNEAVVADPGLINTDPFGAGWIFRLRISEVPALLDARAYGSLTAE